MDITVLLDTKLQYATATVISNMTGRAACQKCTYLVLAFVHLVNAFSKQLAMYSI